MKTITRREAIEHFVKEDVETLNSITDSKSDVDEMDWQQQIIRYGFIGYEKRTNKELGEELSAHSEEDFEVID